MPVDAHIAEVPEVGSIALALAGEPDDILEGMEITLTVPDELAGQISAEGQDPARAALEALALEGYRSKRLSEAEVRRMLGFQTGMQVHTFLKEHGLYLQYGEADLEQDLEEIRRARANRPNG